MKYGTHERNSLDLWSASGEGPHPLLIYILFHDDLADPSASDPVLRESTRVAGVFGQFPKTSIHPYTLNEWIGVEAASHPMIYNAVGAASYVELMNNMDAYEALLDEFSPIHHLDANDPPLYLSYPSAMTLPAATAAAAIHHGMFGLKLKEQADRIGYSKLWRSHHFVHRPCRKCVKTTER